MTALLVASLRVPAPVTTSRADDIGQLRVTALAPLLPPDRRPTTILAVPATALWAPWRLRGLRRSGPKGRNHHLLALLPHGLQLPRSTTIVRWDCPLDPIRVQQDCSLFELRRRAIVLGVRRSRGMRGLRRGRG